MKSVYPFLLLCGLFVFLTACSSVPVSFSTMTPAPRSTQVIILRTPEPTQTWVQSSPTLTMKPPTQTSTAMVPITASVPACVLLHYGEYAQFEIIGPSGQRVLVDIFDPDKLTSPAVDGDVLLTTHTHWDHLNEDFQTNFPGLQLFVQTGILEVPDAIIQGIASSHDVGDLLKPEGGTNYIYLIEIGGLRIAHFGDIGQNTLNQDQLTALGDIDIAITQINNPYSMMDAENRKGINLMEQVQPNLIIPTHSNLDTVKLALTKWDGYYTEFSSVTVCESDLDQERTQLLLVGETVETMIKYVDLELWGDK